MNISTRAATPSPASVVVVDDDPLQRNEIADFLAQSGISAAAVANGFAAMHEIRKSAPRVVVMDIKLPGLDGIHVTRLIEGLMPRPRVILVSGYPEHVRRANQEALGVTAVLGKPLSLKTLRDLILKALNR